MANINFSDFNLSANNQIKEITVLDKVIEVKQYLPAEDKNSILENTIAEADMGTILNTFAIDIYFHMFLIFKYTNLQFTEEEKSDLFALYDILESNGIINQIIVALPTAEYNLLQSELETMIELYNDYRNSAKALVEQFAMFAPNTAADISEKIQNLDIEKMQNVLALADYAGMNNQLKGSN